MHPILLVLPLKHTNTLKPYQTLMWTFVGFFFYFYRGNKWFPTNSHLFLYCNVYFPKFLCYEHCIPFKDNFFLTEIRFCNKTKNAENNKVSGRSKRENMEYSIGNLVDFQTDMYIIFYWLYLPMNYSTTNGIE